MKLLKGLIWILIGFVESTNLQCPIMKRYGRPPPATCNGPMDPNLKPKSKIEKWFTKKMWEVDFKFLH